ncbi:hypothetical protein [Marinobacterium lacunae]|uniref:hypothetical protein n=1 Tax=Marinobacterium lacunae TaxID=1232683 RepID=UPI00055F5D6D|nr:hypothetical protein [Marinobacterium lacunae]
MKIEYIATDIFDQLIEKHLAEGWSKIYEYDNIVDKGIDYDKVVLGKDDRELVFEWDNWLEGNVEGDSQDLEPIEKYILTHKKAKP